MNKICLKSMLLGAALVLIIMLAMGAAGNYNNNVNGRYQITSHIYSNQSRVLVIDTQTGEVRSIDTDASGQPKGYEHYSGIDNSKVYTSGLWEK